MAARMIYKCKNKACKQVRTVEYSETRKVSVGYGRYEYEIYRIDAVRGKVLMGFDSTCVCGQHASGERIKGIVTDHVCDERCMTATGRLCECSCGGKNHGSAYSVSAVQ